MRAVGTPLLRVRKRVRRSAARLWSRAREASADGRAPPLVPQQEVQESIQRFAGQLIERTAQAAAETAGSAEHDGISTEALRRAVLYEAAALDIATEPLPEIALLDMVVFLRLCRRAIADHWLPHVFGERGRPFLTAFEQAEAEFWPIAEKILDSAAKETLIRSIDEWRQRSPELAAVEFVRLTEFSTRAGAVALASAAEVGGVLASVKSATQKADKAMLLGDRALFLAGRLPFLVRHQARLGGREVVGDALDRITESASRADTTVVRALAYLVVLGAVWSLLWWTGYAVAKRVTAPSRWAR
jgi:hypothetical protein